MDLELLRLRRPTEHRILEDLLLCPLSPTTAVCVETHTMVPQLVVAQIVLHIARQSYAALAH